MPDELNAKLDFEEHIKTWPDYAQFIFREVRDMRLRCGPCLNSIADHEIRLTNEEKKSKALFAEVRKINHPHASKKALAAQGGVASAIAAGIVLVVEYLIKLLAK